jgi:hypothetical protein
MRDVDLMARGGTETADKMNEKMNESIAHIRVLALCLDLHMFTLKII